MQDLYAGVSRTAERAAFRPLNLAMPLFFRDQAAGRGFQALRNARRFLEMMTRPSMNRRQSGLPILRVFTGGCRQTNEPIQAEVRPYPSCRPPESRGFFHRYPTSKNRRRQKRRSVRRVEAETVSGAAMKYGARDARILDDTNACQHHRCHQIRTCRRLPRGTAVLSPLPRRDRSRAGAGVARGGGPRSASPGGPSNSVSTGFRAWARPRTP